MRRVSRRLHEDTRFRQRLFYGEMGLAEYHDLMDRFRAMIETRFARRNMEHDALRRWGEYRERVFAMILDKRASLMVFKLVDLGWGDLKHKKNLANRVETYRSDIVYTAKKAWLRPVALALFDAIILKQTLVGIKRKPGT